MTTVGNDIFQEKARVLAAEVVIPEKTHKNEEIARIYKLDFKDGSRIAHCHFECKGGKSVAIQRGKDFCVTMRYKFIHVSPFIEDLDFMEARFKSVGE